VGFGAEEGRKGKKFGPFVAATNPPQRDSAWPLLGYDVADPVISGLSNCGYDNAERGELAGTWGRWINRHHIFHTLEDAFDFASLTNQRVPEHAPFFVIGLWFVESEERGAT
jgi:hypothetical protein